MTDVSVIVPTLGRPDRLRRALESVAVQTRPPREVIVVDASGDDAVVAVTEEFGNRAEGNGVPVEYLRQRGSGVSQARNQGVAASDGELIAFLDDDDWWDPEKLERQVPALESSNSALAYTGFRRVRVPCDVGSDIRKGTTIATHRPRSAPNARSVLAVSGIGTPSSVAMTRESFERVGGFDESFERYEDWEFYIRVLQQFDAIPISEPLVRKEVHDGSISRDTSVTSRWASRVHEKHESKYTPELERRFLARHHRSLGQHYVAADEIGRARREFLRSLRRERSALTCGYLLAACTGERGYSVLRWLYRRYARQ